MLLLAAERFEVNVIIDYGKKMIFFAFIVRILLSKNNSEKKTENVNKSHLIQMKSCQK